MRGFINKYGELVFDYILFTILLNISLLLIIPFIPMVIGINKYINTEKKDRSLSIIFKTIKEEANIILKVTLFLLIVFGFSIYNLYFLRVNNSILEYIIDGLSYILLFIGTIILIHSPTIIGGMKVTFKQLIYNSLMLIFGGLINFLTSIGIIILFIYFSTNNTLVIIFGITLVIALIARNSYINFINLKERVK